MAELNDYRDALIALLPQGQAWPTDPDSDLGKLLTGLAEEFARIDARAQALLNESHPSRTSDLLAEWEEDYGLPDSCLSGSSIFQQRRDRLIAKVLNTGGQSRQFFIDLAASLGYEITITEYKERRFGDPVGGFFGGVDWSFTWQVNTSLNVLKQRRFGSPMGEPFAAWSNTELECVIRKLAHAHRFLIFSYS